MILPSKHISQERALLTIGAKLLEHLDRPKTVSAVWEDMRISQAPISFDWFVLALDLLYAIDTIEIRDGLLIRRTPV
jgi:hypothetical protein